MEGIASALSSIGLDSNDVSSPQTACLTFENKKVELLFHGKCS